MDTFVYRDKIWTNLLWGSTQKFQENNDFLKELKIVRTYSLI